MPRCGLRETQSVRRRWGERLQRKLETRLGRACEATVKLWLLLVERWRTVGLRQRQHTESPGPREAGAVPQASSLGVVSGRSPVH